MPLILTDRLTLSQPGAGYAHLITIAPPAGFLDLPTALGIIKDL